MVASVTNLPVEADRFTLRPFPVPLPTRSVVVVRGDRAAVAFVTKRPVLALRLTDRAMVSSLEHSLEGEGGHAWAPWTPLESLLPLTMELAVQTSSCWADPLSRGPPFYVPDSSDNMSLLAELIVRKGDALYQEFRYSNS